MEDFTIDDLEPGVIGFFEDLGMTTEEEIGACISFISNLIKSEEEDIIEIITEEIENEDIAESTDSPYVSDILEAIRSYAEE